MDEYFYTLDLGPSFGPKLEALAAQASFDDVEAFAAMILCYALRELERHEPDFEGNDEAEEGTPK